MLERLFRLKERGTDPRTEVVAGFTTFMTMAYIIAACPLILSGSANHPAPPLTMSISRGIGVGFVAYALLHLLSGRGRQVPAALYVLSLLFALSFWLERPA